MEPLKIMQVHARYRWLGGEETTVANDAEVLRSGGHEVVQHLVDNPTSTRETFASLSVAPWNMRQAQAVRERARQEGVDVIHVHNTWFSLSPAVLSVGHALGVPTVATIQNYRLACAQGQMIRDGQPCELCLGGSALPGVRYRCYRNSAFLSGWNSVASRAPLRLGVWNRVSSVIVPARFTAEKLIEAGLPRHRVVVRPNTAPDPGPRTHPPEQSNVVLFVGRLSREKGVHHLIDGWKGTATDLELVVVGDGPERSALESGAPDGVTFVGHESKQEVRDRMLAARALVFPSVWYEVCPLVIIEAFAAGLPVFGHAMGAVTELLETQGEEAFVPASTPLAWSDVRQQIADDTLIERLGKFARSSYDERFHPRVGLSSLEVTYAGAVG